MKNIEIIERINRMEGLANISFPVKIAYAIKKNHKKLMGEYKDYEVMLDELNTRYRDLDGGIIESTKTEYQKKLGELLSIDVEIEFHKIPESEFEEANFKITLQQLATIDFMIE
ncbi:MAG: hypothetical protein PWQ06_111 [Anaerophaga sp.]|nr:hypothetical protein [Anaerophaga sp.]